MVHPFDKQNVYPTYLMPPFCLLPPHWATKHLNYCVFVHKSYTCATSPAEYMLGTLLSKYSLTKMPRSVLMGVSLSSSNWGRTPQLPHQTDHTRKFSPHFLGEQLSNAYAICQLLAHLLHCCNEFWTPCDLILSSSSFASVGLNTRLQSRSPRKK